MYMKKKSVGISMVITCYNRAQFIKESIISCIKQEYDGPKQIIIVDDASTDNSVEVIEETIHKFGDGQDIELIRLPENRGVAGATDAGWAKSKHEWILIVDGDDIQDPLRCYYVNEVVQAFPSAIQLAFCLQYINEFGKKGHYSSYAAGYDFETSPEQIIIDSPQKSYNNWFGELNQPRLKCVGATLAFSRKLYDLWGSICQGETKDLRVEQDFVLGFRAALLSNIVGKKRVVLQYRIHSQNLSNIIRSDGFRGVIESELFQDTRYQAFRAASLQCMLRDIRWAKERRELTNWPIEMLEKAEITIRQELAGCEMRDKWWQCNWFERLRRALYYRNKVHKKDKVWIRLLPFRLFCLLKYLRKR